MFYILDPNGNEIHNGKNYKLLEEVIIPNYVTEIKYSTFQNFNCLKKVVLHKDVKLIDSIAFSGCTNLSSIDVGFSDWTPTNATIKWLSGVAANGTFYCPE